MSGKEERQTLKSTPLKQLCPRCSVPFMVNPVELTITSDAGHDLVGMRVIFGMYCEYCGAYNWSLLDAAKKGRDATAFRKAWLEAMKAENMIPWELQEEGSK